MPRTRQANEIPDAGVDVVPDRQLAYAILRFIFGVNFLMHGATWILSGVMEFSSGMVRQFTETLLPPVMVQAFGTMLPFVEAAPGVLLIAGLSTRPTLVAGGAA